MNPPDSTSRAPDIPVAGPATHATRRARSRQRPAGQRAFPLPFELDGTGDAVALAATRALLSVSSREDAAAVLHTAVNDLGGAVVPARLGEANPDATHVDVSLGVGEPQLVVVDAMSVAALRLFSHLPTLVEDAHTAAARCDVGRRHLQRATVDPLTGLASRSEIGPRLGAVRTGDVIGVIDLDGFTQLNDTRGHAAGDDALRQFGSLLKKLVRADDFCGRYGGDEFLLVLASTPVETARRRMLDLGAQWTAIDGHVTSLSTGLAVVGPAGGAAAVAAADRALCVAKSRGRNRVHVSDAADGGVAADG